VAVAELFLILAIKIWDYLIAYFSGIQAAF